MAYLEELLPEFRKGARIRKKDWDKDLYLYYKDGLIYDQYHQPFYSLLAKSILGDCWEFYQEPEPDWQYIIDHKCLCYFWDNNDDRRIGLLTKISISGSYNRRLDYLMNSRLWYEHCRPVRRDEVTFYEDKEDE